jgi:hypothetical protein
VSCCRQWQIIEGLPVCLRPSNFARITLHFEIFVTLAPAKIENRGIISYKGDAVAGIDTTRAEPAFLNSHGDERPSKNFAD